MTRIGPPRRVVSLVPSLTEAKTWYGPSLVQTPQVLAAALAAAR
ncbi:hypothetical protein [Streptomyces natalensis]|nr:hypothetical protein [Streptomyces natalensis]